ncbi:hypothetical protein ACFWQG_12940 [Rhodococcus sp. NPDC058532]|uniref:hypothetical protein n=1 Tax=Rhodococcus sp. NPDC058532 TaxID=3346540 RepID=UPI0036671E3F
MSITIQRYSRPESGYTQICNDFMRASIPVSAHRVACYILSHESGWKLTFGRIADAIGLSRNTVTKAVSILVELGYAVRIPLLGGTRGRAASESLIVSDTGFTTEERAALLADTTPRKVPKNCAESTPAVHENGAPQCAEIVHPSAQKLGTIRRSLLEDQEEEGGHLSRERHQRDAETSPTLKPSFDPAPADAVATVGAASRHCPRHPDGTTAPCGPCGDARRAHDERQVAEKARVIEARRSDEDDARAARYAVIDACARCDDQGFIPADVPTRCTHDQPARTRPSIRELFAREKAARA